MQAPAFWWRKPGFEAALLRPAAMIYASVADRRLRQQGERAGVPVVCIGNPTVGGAGKTPTAIAIAHLLHATGETPLLLTRGYGGRETGPVRVDPARHDAPAVGDEPLLLARHFTTIVSRDRRAGARMALTAGASVVVMDDGFQNPSLDKDVAILVVDARRGIGNGCVLPAGPLRASLMEQLHRAHALLVIGSGDGAGEIASAARAAGLRIFSARLEPDEAACEALRQSPVLAFAGIGDPEKFFTTLAQAGIQTPVRRSFADHNRYTAVEAADLLGGAQRRGLTLLTTEKDFARMAGDDALSELRARARVLPVTLVCENPSALQDFVLERIRQARANRSHAA
jgi:tetraacyldisaccharide 4'-kinase